MHNKVNDIFKGIRMSFVKNIKKHYILCFTPIYIALLLLFIFLPQNISFPAIVSLTGIYLSLIFFFQKQNLEELRVFKELFTEFNNRYDNLNDKLVDIANGTLTGDDAKKVLDDYFNLCSEEYLFYSKGLIISEAWGSWCRGIKENLNIKAVKDYWSVSQNEESYYGLTTEVINEGSKL